MFKRLNVLLVFVYRNYDRRKREVFLADFSLSGIGYTWYSREETFHGFAASKTNPGHGFS